MRNTFWQGFWRLADPKISLASMASIFLGVCASAGAGEVDVFWLTLTILGIFAIEVAKNASGEIFDFDSGTDQAVHEKDRSPFSGGKRVLVDAILTRKQAIAISLAAYITGIVIGLMIVFKREPQILWIGMLGVAAAYLYHAPPLKLSYRGLGEIAVAICYGPLICVGTYMVQRGQATFQIAAVSILLGLLIANFLLINEFPDYHADKASDKKTLTVRLGRKTAARLFTWTFALTLFLLLFLPLMGLSPAVWLGGIAIPSGISASKRLLKDPEIVPNIIPAQVHALVTFILFAIGAGMGFLLS